MGRGLWAVWLGWSGRVSFVIPVRVRSAIGSYIRRIPRTSTCMPATPSTAAPLLSARKCPPKIDCKADIGGLICQTCCLSKCFRRYVPPCPFPDVLPQQMFPTVRPPLSLPLVPQYGDEPADEGTTTTLKIWRMEGTQSDSYFTSTGPPVSTDSAMAS